MNLVHFNDGKGKWQSHEIFVKDNNNFYNSEFDVFSHNPFDITGYGETKDDALNDFKKKFDYIMKELKVFETFLYETNLIEDNIVEVGIRRYAFYDTVKA